MSEDLVHATRGNLVESIHSGDIAVVDWQGKLLYRVGSPEQKVTFIRSSSKPLQALPVVESGAAQRYGFNDEELAVMCASHSGEEGHINTVRGILKKIGLSESNLKCGSHLPSNKEAAQEMIKSQVTPTEIHCNCSGKHSGMLALCQHFGWDIDNYTDIEHPVQQMLLDKMARFARLNPSDIEIGTDGCGVPVYGLSVYHMASAFARLANPSEMSPAEQHAVEVITSAMRKKPFYVAGTGRLCTALMEVSAGKVFAKGGAEGVYCVGVPDLGIGVALKSRDGNGARCSGPAIVEALRQLGVLSPEQVEQLQPLARPQLYNHRRDIIGEAKAVFSLVRL